MLGCLCCWCSDTIASEMFPSWKDLFVLRCMVGGRGGGPGLAWLYHESHGVIIRVSCVPLLQGLCAMDRAPEYVPSAHQFGLAEGSHLMLPFNQLAVRKR